MNVLIIGQNTKMAKVFSTIPSKVYILVENEADYYRPYYELSEYITIESSTKITSFRGIFQRCHEIGKIIEEHYIDVILSNEKSSMIAAYMSFTLLAKRHVILLSTSHNSYAWNNPWKVRAFSRLIRICTHGYISLASFVTESLINNKVNPQKILTITNPAELGLFDFKISYNILQSCPSAIYVGVQNEGKGQLTLIKAVKLLKDRGLLIHVSLVGDIINEEYHRRNLDYVKNNNLDSNIQFLGKVDNIVLRKTISTYDIYVCPSEMEMSPYNILEAKSAGMPIIASSVGGIPDIITDGEDGLLIPAKSERDLADAIELLLKENKLRKKIGESAYKKAISIHSPEFLANKIREFISLISASSEK